MKKISILILAMLWALFCSCSKNIPLSAIEFIQYDKPVANLEYASLSYTKDGSEWGIFGQVDYPEQLPGATDDEVIFMGYGYLNDYVKVKSDNHLDFIIPKDMLGDYDGDFRNLLNSPRCYLISSVNLTDIRSLLNSSNYLISNVNPLSESTHTHYNLFSPDNEIDVDASDLYDATVKVRKGDEVVSWKRLNRNVRYLFYLMRVGVFNSLSCYSGFVSDDQIEKLFIESIPSEFYVRVACPLYK